MTKSETIGVQNRIARTIDKALKNENYDLILFINDLRKHLHGI